MVFLVVFAIVLCWNSVLQAQAPPNRTGMTGQQLYRAGCVACHGADGKRQPIALRGFALEPPDFTDCRLTTPEADLDWQSVIHEGGPARAFDPLMPAFGDELTVDEISKIIEYVRTFCVERGWPHGDLNMPRPFVTEKAYPENEMVLTTTIVPNRHRSVANELVYEQRIGKRGQYEVIVPFDLQQGANGVWSRGVGDIGGAYKHVLFDSVMSGSIVSAGAEITFPTGSAAKGLGSGVARYEVFGTYSQALPLPTDGFLHVHAGFETAADTRRAPKEAFWRVAMGKSYMSNRWGRTWSPMIEMLGARELLGGGESEWDLLPQIQISLSTRQHVLLNVGMRVPVNETASRRSSVLVYLLWDWFDGGFFSGW